MLRGFRLASTIVNTIFIKKAVIFDYFLPVFEKRVKKMDKRFEMIRPLGVGGQGSVFLVRDLQRQNKLLALKRVGDDEEHRAELALEFNRLKGLRHRNLAQAYDFGKDDEGPYLTSEYVDGPELLSWAQEAGEEEVCRAMAAVLRGLALVHDRDLVHGDVSPQNILVHLGEDEVVPKLLDLGGACRPGQTGTGSTAGFVAPEVLKERGALPASDLYSFGVLLALALFNKHPFAGEEASATVQRQLEGKADLPDANGSPIARLCLDLLNPDPAKRPSSAREALERLAQVSGIDFALELGALRPGGLPVPKFVGRGAELGRLCAILDRFDSSTVERVSWIRGPLGSGRSALLNAVVREAQLVGVKVIGQVGRQASTAHLINGLVQEAGYEQLLPATRRYLSPWIENGEDETEAGLSGAGLSSVGFAVAETLLAACSSGPVLVVLDDLTSDDPVLVEIVATLIRALTVGRAGRPAAALVVAGDAECAEFVSSELVGIDISLEPLEQPLIEELVRSMLPMVTVPDDLARAVYIASKGWPGAAEQLVRQAVGPGGGGELTQRARELVEAAAPVAQEILGALSSTGEPVGRELLEKVGGTNEIIETLLRDGFLYESPGAAVPRLMVAKDAGVVAREVVSKNRLSKMCRRLAGELESSSMLAAGARLWEQAGDLEGMTRCRGTLAMRLREQGDLVGASSWFTLALKQMAKGKSRQKLAQAAVSTWRTVGRFDLALEGLSDTGLSTQECQRIEAELTFEQGRHSVALNIAKQALEKTPLDLTLRGVVAASQLQLGQHEQCLATAGRVLDDPPLDGAKDALARMALVGGLACTYLGRIDDAATMFSTAHRGFTQAEDFLGLLKVSANQGLLQRRKGDLAGARTSYNRAIELARQLGDRVREGLHLMNRATISHVACDYGAAHADYLAAIDIATVLGHEFQAAQAEINLADLLTDLGVSGQAGEVAARALERCRVLGQERLEVRALLVAGTAARKAGDPLRAERCLKEARRRFAAAGDESGLRAADLQLAQLWLMRGDLKRARVTAMEVAAAAKRGKQSRERARALILLAQIYYAGDENLEEALVALDDAEHSLKKEPSWDFLWRLSLCRAHVLKRLGRGAEAKRSQGEAKAAAMRVLERVPDEFRRTFIGGADAEEIFSEAQGDEETSSNDRWSRDLELLMEINRELARERDPKRLLALIMENAVELTGAERGMIVMPRDGSLSPVIAHQISDDIDVNFSRSVAEKVVAEGRSALAIDALDDERFSAFVSVNTMQLRSILAVPLKIRRRVVGAIYLDSRLRSGVFSDADRRLLESFGAQAAIALETARLLAENASRVTELKEANLEISDLTTQLESKLERNQAKLKRVDALLKQSQTNASERLLENGIVGRSPAMQSVMKIVDKIALADVPVYIFGASGTGKELVARALHAASERSSSPFVPINCGALPPQLLASELFGHKKGAFTGAVGDRPGLFRLSHNGTLFLDEITDMDQEMQAHLLRVLQDGTFRSLGDNEEVSVDVRILSASNRDLQKEVAAGRFREDLMYRLNVVRIEVPLLSERREDIPLLIDYFTERHAVGETPSFSRPAMDLLVGAEWAGNVRELENEVLRAMTLATPGKPIEPDDLSPRLCKGFDESALTGEGSLKERVDSFERIIIQGVLSDSKWNATRAAKTLGISRAGLYKKLDKYKIER
jgi:transcriptional regulator with GAF, ATPase, and Fis domain/tetratricopeptide (TPR) repeat protein